MDNRSYYEILRVSTNASEAEIRSAYHRQIRFFHPDQHGGKSESDRLFAEEETKRINEAKEVLLNGARRTAYDSSQAGGRASTGSTAPPNDQSGSQSKAKTQTERQTDDEPRKPQDQSSSGDTDSRDTRREANFFSRRKAVPVEAIIAGILLLLAAPIVLILGHAAVDAPHGLDATPLPSVSPIATPSSSASPKQPPSSSPSETPTASATATPESPSGVPTYRTERIDIGSNHILSVLIPKTWREEPEIESNGNLRRIFADPYHAGVHVVIETSIVDGATTPLQDLESLSAKNEVKPVELRDGVNIGDLDAALWVHDMESNGGTLRNFDYRATISDTRLELALLFVTPTDEARYQKDIFDVIRDSVNVEADDSAPQASPIASDNALPHTHRVDLGPVGVGIFTLSSEWIKNPETEIFEDEGTMWVTTFHNAKFSDVEIIVDLETKEHGSKSFKFSPRRSPISLDGLDTRIGTERRISYELGVDYMRMIAYSALAQGEDQRIDVYLSSPPDKSDRFRRSLEEMVRAFKIYRGKDAEQSKSTDNKSRE